MGGYTRSTSRRTSKLSPAERRCPDSETILRFVGGQFVEEDGVWKGIEEHLAACPDCGRELDAAIGACTAIAAEGFESALETSLPAWLEEAGQGKSAIADARRHVEEIFRCAPSEWRGLIAGHPDRGSPELLDEIAERAVWFADDEPEVVLALVSDLLPGVTQDARAVEFRALLGLAAGTAWTARGDLISALEAFAKAEAGIGARVLSHAYARICLSRAGTLRRLNRADEAEADLEIARQIFARYTDRVGTAKTLWAHGNLSWHRGSFRLAFRQYVAAHREFEELGNDADAHRLLQDIAGALIALHRPRAAQRVLSAVRPAGTQGEQARLQRKLGQIAAMLGEHEAGIAQLEGAAESFAAVGDPQGAGWCLLHAADVAGLAGLLERRVELASRALQLLSPLPGLAADAATALEELRSAIGSTAGIAVAVRRALGVRKE